MHVFFEPLLHLGEILGGVCVMEQLQAHEVNEVFGRIEAGRIGRHVEKNDGNKGLQFGERLAHFGAVCAISVQQYGELRGALRVGVGGEVVKIGGHR